MTMRVMSGLEILGPHAALVHAVLRAALAAVDPQAAVQAHLQVLGETLRVGPRRASGRAVTHDLRRGRVFLLGVGKAAYPMTRAAWETVAPWVADCLVVTKDGYAGPTWPGCTVLQAGHPVPDARSLAAAQAAQALLHRAGPHDVVLVLLSGGGSALLTWPVPGVSLADLQTLTQALLASGATIHEINAVRKHLDRVKGGGLALWAAPARVVTLALSDVLGDDPSVIASGPTVADPSTFAEAWAVLARYGLTEALPPGVRAHLQAGLAGRVPETPKPGDPRLQNSAWFVVGSVRHAAEAAATAARQQGWHAGLLTTTLQGEAREAGRVLAAVLQEMARLDRPWPRPGCALAGGETTVTLGPNPGRGGRNQELALAAVPLLAGLPGVALVAFATDGTDGPTDAAGAVVTSQTLARARALGLDPRAHLARHDAYAFFDQVGGLLRPGPTRTNVNDLVLLCTWRDEA